MASGADQAVNAATVLLAGASSQIGVFAIPRLLASGFNVIALSRSGRPQGWPDHGRVQWLDETAAARHMDGCQYLLSAGPMEVPCRLLNTANCFEKVVIFSSTSADTKINSNVRQEREQARNLLELESELGSSAARNKTRLVILRPTLVYGCGLDRNISLLANWINRFGFIPVNRKALGLRQPVHADDLATVAVEILNTDKDLPGLLNVAGGETLAYSEMVARIFSALGKPTRLLSLPGWLFASLIGLAKMFKASGGINREMVRRQSCDLVFDDSEAREMLAYNPRPFNPTASDFHRPDL